MVNLKRFILIILFFSIAFATLHVSSFATNIDMNLAQEQNITDSRNNSSNNINNSADDNEQQPNSSTSNTSLNTNTSATVQSVEQFEDNTSSFDISNIINILLLAVGLVIILLAVAILIRLKK